MLPKNRAGRARPVAVSPQKRHVQSFPFPVHMKAEVMRKKMMYDSLVEVNFNVNPSRNNKCYII